MIEERPRALNVNKSAKYLGDISPKTVRTLIKLGRLRVVRVSPRRIVIEVAELERYIAAHREGGGR